jgi:hypothetical protein
MNWRKLTLTLGLLAWYAALAIGINILSGNQFGWVIAAPLAPAAALFVGILAAMVGDWWEWVTDKEYKR